MMQNLNSMSNRQQLLYVLQMSQAEAENRWDDEKGKSPLKLLT